METSRAVVFRLSKNSPAWHGICGVSVYFVCVYERERIHSWRPVLQRILWGKKKLQTTNTGPGLRAFDEIQASRKWKLGFGSVAGSVPNYPHPGWALEPVFPSARYSGFASKSEGQRLPGTRLCASLPLSVKQGWWQQWLCLVSSEKESQQSVESP